MSRTIQFRGERKDNGEWVYGYYRIGALAGGTYIKDYLVKENTVGQYTGRKDKYGEKIFEGDIVLITRKINGNFVERIFEKKRICWQGSAFVFQPVDRDLSYPNLIRLNENETMEVIGNIYDNPELLKEADNA